MTSFLPLIYNRSFRERILAAILTQSPEINLLLQLIERATNEIVNGVADSCCRESRYVFKTPETRVSEFKIKFNSYSENSTDKLRLFHPWNTRDRDEASFSSSCLPALLYRFYYRFR